MTAAPLPDRWTIKTYVAEDGEAVAHVFEPRRAKGGKVKRGLLPATVFGPDARTAADALTAFLQAEIAAKAAIRANAAATGARSAARAARAKESPPKENPK